jgi:hypothetical protein
LNWRKENKDATQTGLRLVEELPPEKSCAGRGCRLFCYCICGDPGLSAATTKRADRFRSSISGFVVPRCAITAAKGCSKVQQSAATVTRSSSIIEQPFGQTYGCVAVDTAGVHYQI